LCLTTIAASLQIAFPDSWLTLFLTAVGPKEPFYFEQRILFKVKNALAIKS
jgi:hypothetical protein